MTPLFSELFDRLGTWLIFALWQSTLLLGTAILLRRLFWRSPWRSHVLLTLGIISAAIAPTFSTIVAFQNGGLLGSGNFWRSDIFESLILRSGWLGLLLMFGAVMFATLLGYGILTSRRLMFRARPFPDRESQEALLRSAKMLKHVSLPILFTSDGVKSPTVWCWGLHPAVLLPETLTKKLSAEERDAIFLHELAHISRRDHFSALATRICGAFLFWNPLYWLALWQNDLASDQACDLLVLSQGTVLPEQYTETLLRLAAGEKRRPAFQFLSRKEKMMKRINTILDFAEHASKFPVRTQPLWTGSVVSLALLTCVVLAFCQEKKNDEASKVKFDTYSVMKKVGEFPDGDLSTPEAAYSTYNKTMASKDKDIIAKLKEYDFNKKMKIPQREIDNIVNMPDDWANILKTATVKEVYLCGDMAKAVAFLDGENTQKAYDTRSFRKVDGKWLNEGNDRVDSLEEAAKKFADRIQKAASKTGENSGEIVTSLEKFLKVEGLKRYPVKKRIADFPADAIDLSSPEKSYATQKNLIISNREDKFEQLSNMTAGRPKISERERKGMEEKIPEDQAQTWREEFVVFEMFVLNDKYAFVFGFRQSDDLYDGNYFVKQGDEWLNAGNEQSMGAEEIAKRVQTVFSRRAKVLQALTSPDSEAVTSYEVNKKVTDFPTDQIDLSTPESAYVLITRTMTGDAPDKLETLALYTLGRIKVPESGQKFIENMPDEYRESQKNARIVKVLVYKNSSAMVIAELENPKSFYFLWMKKDDNNHWLTFGNGTVKNINDAEKAFHAAVERWDKEKEPWKSPDNVGHTHLFTFAGKGSFKPQTPKELLD
ncbi:MAG: M56 family metallopeptidase, partial [Planctomycetaceae bacterium]|nr:M56 family metallopeptidase [Planctomycetaceae bacterium]